ncbi:ABC transporter ATP-binding protein [Synechococcus sp. PCC 6312]|uniref:ABC transporter ATP-binding protein n=1 Tax=Synechococcus sp. (strain ATCC 27167 / PCC 6312) TaxID=195253 RepID=UPI00029EE2BD|nr:ABC transporter ATP-binding protein [Synechococcus sp. PCC 6312]AFY61661.1 amino acid/amide ABC transporter ATP-binding protein 1, HAAT family [Synechococcus sp. PCC 6312]
MDDLSPLLSIQHLSRTFGGLVAVNDVSFAIETGEIFGLIGPNGAGKTTLFNIITGVIPPTQGQFLLRNQSLVGYHPHQITQRGIARTFQNIRLFRDLSVLDNVLIGRHIHTPVKLWPGILPLKKVNNWERVAKEEALELLNLLGLGGRQSEKASHLAYGEQRRLEIARALAVRPQILLLDEPAAGMNPTEKQELCEFIRQIQKTFQLTIVLIEHHVPLVMGLSDRIAVLDFGQLIALGKPDAVRQDAAVIAAYLGDQHEP